MTTLVKSLKETGAITLMEGAQVKAIKKLENQISLQILGEDQISSFDHVICSAPAPHTASLLSPQETSLSDALNEISYVSIAVVNLGYEAGIIPPELRGFGYLIPPKEGEPILGVAFDSYSFPEQDGGRESFNPEKVKTRITVMMGGDLSVSRNYPDVKRMNDAEILRIAKDALNRHLNLKAEPEVSHVTVCSDGIPQYVVGHSKRVTRIESETHRLFEGRLTLVGPAVGSVGVNDCIENARVAVAAIN